MIVDMHYWSKVLKKILLLLLSIIGIYLAFKLAIFYMPFLIAFILSLLIEPIIRFLMKYFKFTRKASSILVFVVALGIIIGLLAWGIITLITESSNLLEGLNGYFSKISTQFQNLVSEFDMSKFAIPQEFLQVLQNAGNDLLATVSEWAKDALNGLLNVITSIPTIAIYTVVSIIALYFICTDKIYMLDQVEHHLPEIWVKRLGKHVREIIHSLGCFLKAEAILVLASFIVCLIGLYTFQFMGMKVEYPLLAALGIGFVDALPIFGSATVMIPWAIIVACDGDITLGVSLIILLIIMGMVRQFMEPRVVSGQIGIHPIFTLIAMYTGFRLIGVIGMFISGHAD